MTVYLYLPNVALEMVDVGMGSTFATHLVHSGYDLGGILIGDPRVFEELANRFSAGCSVIEAPAATWAWQLVA